MPNLLHTILHVDQELKRVILEYGTQTYGILFAIVFCETGLVVMPFLPGDSLLFASGIFAHPTAGSGGEAPLNIWLLYLTFVCAALLGDNVNYQLGRLFGRNLFKNENSKIFKRSNLEKTHEFFDKYGGKTIIIARFVPIVRTFAPFVAGMGSMEYPRFLMYSVAGAFIWVGVCVSAGYFFGSIPIVQKNFSIAMIAIILVTVLPAVFEIIKHRRKQSRK